jgi:hypothetical protein
MLENLYIYQINIQMPLIHTLTYFFIRLQIRRDIRLYSSLTPLGHDSVVALALLGH